MGDLPARPLTSGGYDEMTINLTSESGEKVVPPPFTELKLKDADALLYLGPRDSLTVVSMPRTELDGTPYGKEIARRLTIIWGASFDFLPDKEEGPQFSPPGTRNRAGCSARGSANSCCRRGPSARTETSTTKG